MYKQYLLCLSLLSCSSCDNVLHRTYQRETINANITELARSDRKAARMVIWGTIVYSVRGRRLEGVPLDSLYQAGLIKEHYADSTASADAHRATSRELSRLTDDAKQTACLVDVSYLLLWILLVSYLQGYINIIV